MKCDELLPCPFCGGEAEYGFTMAGEEVYCKKCGAAMPRTTTKQATITAWNTRSAGTCEMVHIKHGTLYDVYRCDKCGYTHANSNTDRKATWLEPNYCPNCGRKVSA